MDLSHIGAWILNVFSFTLITHPSLGSSHLILHQKVYIGKINLVNLQYFNRNFCLLFGNALGHIWTS